MGLFETLKNLAAKEIATGLKEGKNITELQQSLEEFNQAGEEAKKVVKDHIKRGGFYGKL